MKLTRKVFVNKKTNQLSITLPKKRFKKGIPLKVSLKIERIDYLPKEEVDFFG